MKDMAKYRQKRKQGSKIGIIAVSIVVLMLSGVIFVKSRELRLQNEEYITREENLADLIEQEENRSLELEEYTKYMQTKKYIEDVARDKLGLVYPDEIMLKPE